MRRHLLACVALASLLLCAGAVQRGVHSYKEPDQIAFTMRHSLIEIHAIDGDFIVGVAHFHLPEDTPLTTNMPLFSHQRLGPVTGIAFFAANDGALQGFGSEGHALAYDFSGNPRWAIAIIRYGWIVGALTILPLAWVVRKTRSSRRDPSQCSNCGYSLTGNTSGVCAECGTPVAAKSAAKA